MHESLLVYGFIDGAFIIVLYICRRAVSKVDWINFHSCCLGAFLPKETGDAYAGGQHVSLVLGARGSSVDDDETGGGAPGLERHVVSYFTTLVNAQLPCFYFVLSPPPCTEPSTSQLHK